MIELLKLLSTPIMFILALLVCGIFYLITAYDRSASRKSGICLVGAGILLLYLFSIKPISNLLAYSIESRYGSPSKETLQNLDVLIILGGGFFPSGGFRTSPESSAATYSRLFNGVEIFKNSSANTLVLSGTDPLGEGGSDAEVMKQMAIKLGVPADKIITESVSRNTMEHVVEFQRMFSARSDLQIGIVTSAMHMLRAERAFRKKIPDDLIVAIPVNHMSSQPRLFFNIRNFIPSVDNLAVSSCVAHEFIGMVWYFLQNAI